MSKVCKNCKNMIQPGSRFCERCGQPIKKKKTALWVVLAVLFVAAAALVAVLLWQRDKASRRETDIESAKQIQKAVERAMRDDEAASDMEAYKGALLLPDEDMDYLPESFRDAFEDELRKVPELSYTEDGAEGFSFCIEEDGDVTVYIRSAERLDEWEIEPRLSSRYEDGKKEESRADLIQDIDYRYGKLVSEDSPIMGYWQGDDAAVYIGWNTLPQEEGLSLYLFAVNDNYAAINRALSYTWTGNMGEIKFAGAYEELTTVELTDPDHMTVTIQNTEYTEYHLTRAKLDDSESERFCGYWPASFVEDGYSVEITYDKGYQFKEYYEDETQRASDETSIVLYNGQDALLFITPTEDAEYNIYSRTRCGIDADNPDEMHYGMSFSNDLEIAHEGYTVYREGSESQQYQEALKAYRNYLNELDDAYAYEYDDDDEGAYQYVELIYLDDDAIPELVYRDNYMTDTLLSYSDGEVLAFRDDDWGMSTMSYREKTGEFCVSGVNGSWGHSAYYKFENGTVTDQGSAEIAFYSLFDDDADDEYYIGDSNDSVSEKKYNDYMDSFGDYDTVITGYYTSIWDAYDNFDEQ